MTVSGWAEILVFCALLIVLSPLLGGYMAKVYTGQRVFLTPLFARPERFLLPLLPRRSRPRAGLEELREEPDHLLARRLDRPLRGPAHAVDPAVEQLRRRRRSTPAPWDVTFNTTSSFLTNTNWQYYGGETTLTYFSQMLGLTVQNFLSAGVGIVVAVALVRGIANRSEPQPRELLRRHRPHGPLRAGADLVRQRARADLAGLDPEHLALRLGARHQRRRADDRDGAGRLAGGDQGARHQRRRLLQRRTPRTRSRTRPASRTSSRCCSC